MPTEKKEVIQATETKADSLASESTPPFTVFSVPEKYFLVVLSALIAGWSAMSAPIYFPALGTIEANYNISEELANLSVVVYLLAQGISPMFFAGFADIFGRRPVMLACLVIFMAASIGIALVDNYSALLVLRCIQSAGISPSVAVSSGVVGDFTERHEKGWFLGILAGLTLVGNAFGSLLGAGLVAGFNWRAIFWFLSIGGGFSLIVGVLMLPETKRSFVGNGSVTPKRLINKAPLLMLPRFRAKWNLDHPDLETVPEEPRRDFLATLKIVSKPEIALCLLCGSLHSGLWFVILTCLTTQLANVYKYTVLQIGLCFLPSGFGCMMGSLLTGRIIDYVYARLHNKFLKDIETGAIPADSKFNLIYSRIVIMFPFIFLADGFAVMYGWCLDKEVHIAAICVSTFFVSMCCLSVMNVNMTMLVDLYPEHASAATSGINLTRCLTAALFTGVLTSMNNSLTMGGTITLVAGFCLVSSSGVILPVKYADKWREAREKKAREKELQAVTSA